MKEYIGVLDSGVGGLSVFSHLKKLMPQENFIFFGDTKNVPYGTKSKEELFTLTKKILDFFIDQNVKHAVFACNTTSAVVYEDLEKHFRNKLNIFPLIQSVVPDAIKGLKDNDTVIVLATCATAKSKKYDNEIHRINKNINVHSIDCTGFVEIVENRLYNDPKAIELIKSKLEPLKKLNAKRVILGCTHYPYLVDIFKNILNTEYFDPGLYLAHAVKNNTTNHNKDGVEKFFVTKNPEEFILSANNFYSIKTAQQINLD